MARKEQSFLLKLGAKLDANFSASMAKAEKNLSKIEAKAKSMGKKMLTVTGSIAGVAVSATKAAIDFEDAFAGVKKTVDATPEQFAKIETGIRDMAKEIPSAATDIAAIAENAGQLGIETESILKFTRVMADLGVATNLSGEEAAQTLAKFANITGMDQSNFDRLGSTIVALGNNLATTEADIANMGMNLAAAGKQVKMPESDILSFAGSLSSVGLEAQAGGTAFSKLMLDMQKAVQLGNKDLAKFAKVANMTASGFKNEFGNNASGAITAFLEGLGKIENKTLVLEDLGVKEVRLRDALLRASEASDVFKNSLALGTGAWQENSALTNEAAQKYETTASKLQILKNRVADLGISFGEQLMPMLDGLMNKLEGAIAWFSGLSDGQKQMIIKIGLVVAAIGPLLLIISKVIAVVKTLIPLLKVLKLAFTGLGGPVGLVFTLAAVAITAVAVAIELNNKRLKEADLAKRFGKITLSLQELKNVAKHIVKDGNIDKLHDSIAAFEDIKKFEQSISDAVKALDKTNWKVSIGMKLSQEDIRNYRKDIENFISDSKELITQRQFSINLALDVFTDNDRTGQSIRDSINAFYNKNQSKVTELGAKLQAAVNDSFADGLLTIDEAQKISELQTQLANITNKLAQSEYEAKLDVLGMKFSGANLTGENFKELQDEINKEVENAISNYDKGLSLMIADAKIRLNDGAINQAQYDAEISQYKQKYLENVGAIELKASEFQLNTISETYGAELAAALPKIKENMMQQFNDLQFSSNLNIFNPLKGASFLDPQSEANMKDMFANLKEPLEGLKQLAQKYKDAGQAIPQNILQGITDMTAIGALSGDQNSMLTMMGLELSQDDPKFQAIQANYFKAGTSMPTALMEGMALGKDAMKAHSNKMFNEGILISDINGAIVSGQNYTTSFAQGLTFGKSGIETSVTDILGILGADSPQFQTAFTKINTTGQKVPDSLAQGINIGQDKVLTAADNMLASLKSRLEQGVSAKIPVQTTVNMITTTQVGNDKIPGFATGGYITKPTLATFAEKSPEWAIPDDGSTRSEKLWEAAGRKMGLLDRNREVGDTRMSAVDTFLKGGGGTVNNYSSDSASNFNPVINLVIQGSTNDKDIQTAVDMTRERFRTMFEELEAERKRLSFGRS